MFSVNNFYDYLTSSYGVSTKNNTNLFYTFPYPGCRNLFLLKPTQNMVEYDSNETLHNYRLHGAFFALDDEPIDFDYYHNMDTAYFNSSIERISFSNSFFSKTQRIFFELARLHTPIICHSEKNSKEIDIFKGNGFLDVHYWYHALIARDWFRHWKFYDFRPSSDQCSKRFGLYVRDASGSRQYRLKMLDYLENFSDQVYFKINDNLSSQIKNKEIFKKWDSSNEDISSNSSASISINDIERFNIQLVAETLFDTEKVHLTEKIFKPIVMNQPFIVFSGPKSLEYIKSYGFKTFSSIWNEDYDNIIDTNERVECILALIKDLYLMPSKKFNQLIKKSKSIVNHNRLHFYSDQFEKNLMKELWNNFDNAISQQKINYKNDPGGLWLQNLNLLYSKANTLGPYNQLLQKAISTLKIKDATAADMIIKKYRHLF